MSENHRKGGLKAAETAKKLYGEDYYSRIGKIGGAKQRPETRTFVTNPELARRAGKLGGLKSRRGKKAS